MKRVVFVLAVFAFFTLNAHHGAGVYDTTTVIDVTGTVTEFQFRNPHVLIFIDAENEAGQVVNWSGELTSRNRLARQVQENRPQWTNDILEPGDTITLTGNPAGNGSPFLRLIRVEASDGTVLIGPDQSPAEEY
jgi:hypothetical protein